LAFLGVLTPLMGLPGVWNSLEELASLLDYRRFLATPGKTQLAWGFRNPRYCLGFSKPLLLPGVYKTPATARGF